LTREILNVVTLLRRLPGVNRPLLYPEVDQCDVHRVGRERPDRDREHQPRPEQHGLAAGLADESHLHPEGDYLNHRDSGRLGVERVRERLAAANPFLQQRADGEREL